MVYTRQYDYRLCVLSSLWILMANRRSRISLQLSKKADEHLKLIKESTGLSTSVIIEGMIIDFMSEHAERIERLKYFRERGEKSSSLIKTIYEKTDKEN